MCVLYCRKMAEKCVTELTEEVEQCFNTLAQEARGDYTPTHHPPYICGCLRIYVVCKNIYTHAYEIQAQSCMRAMHVKVCVHTHTHTHTHTPTPHTHTHTHTHTHSHSWLCRQVLSSFLLCRQKIKKHMAYVAKQILFKE